MMFDTVGKKTKMLIRFSTVGGERGSADTARDPRGFSMKFYTEEGNWDLVGNNTPIFFIADPILFPSFIHTQKRNPVTNLKDPGTAQWLKLHIQNILQCSAKHCVPAHAMQCIASIAVRVDCVHAQGGVLTAQSSIMCCSVVSRYLGTPDGFRHMDGFGSHTFK
eukprot:19338-Heterococcus_DN1.PRE.1